MPLKLTKDNTANLEKNLRALLRNDVLVGVPDTTAERQPSADDKTLASNALIAFVQNNGSPARNIPARPFMQPGIESAKDAITAQMKKGGEAAIQGDMGGIERAQNATGLVAQAAIKAKITAGIPPPLSDKTIKARQARGATRTTPLVDTGQLLNSIAYVIRPKGS